MSSDYTDWPLDDMRNFEKMLKCPICYEWLKGSVIFDNCGHAFCSLCIRRSLNVHQKCPVCEKETGMTNLRSVWILDDLAKRFQKCRTWLLEESIRKVKEITEVTKINPADDPSSLFNLDQIKTCPYCKWDFDLDSIKIHMNQCKSLTSTNKNKGDGERDGGDGGKSTILHQHLAKPIYHMLKDSQIKKKLAELDLPTDGDRNKLIWRHSEYVSMWNAKMIDTRIPSKESDIKLELMKLEKNFFSSSSKKDHQQHHNHHATNSITISNPEEYKIQNKRHFRELTMKLREKNNKKIDSSSTTTLDVPPSHPSSSLDSFCSDP